MHIVALINKGPGLGTWKILIQKSLLGAVATGGQGAMGPGASNITRPQLSGLLNYNYARIENPKKIPNSREFTRYRAIKEKGRNRAKFITSSGTVFYKKNFYVTY
jgi:hypothetical protein